jgi:hypothetical protein
MATRGGARTGFGKRSPEERLRLAGARPFATPLRTGTSGDLEPFGVKAACEDHPVSDIQKVSAGGVAPKRGSFNERASAVIL